MPPNSSRGKGPGPIDFSKLLQDVYQGKIDPQEIYMMLAHNRITRAQHDLLASAAPQSFGQRIGFSDRPSIQTYQALADKLAFPPHSPNALANPEQNAQLAQQNAQNAVPISDLPAAYPGVAAPAAVEPAAGLPLPDINNPATLVGGPINTEVVSPTGAFSSGGSTFLPVLPQGLQQQVEGLYSNTLKRLNNNFNNGGGIDAIINQRRRQFNEETIPSIAERFTSMGSGAQRSSGFQQALGRAASNFETDIAALQAEHNLNEQRHLLSSLPILNPYNQIYEPQDAVGMPSPSTNIQQGWGRDALPTVGKSIAAGLAGAAQGYLTGGPVGAALGGAAGVISPLANVSPETTSTLASRINARRNKNQAQPSALGTPIQLTPEQQQVVDQISRTAGPNRKLTPYEQQIIDSITGNTGAAEDFMAAYGQPAARRLTYAEKMRQRKARARARR